MSVDEQIAGFRRVSAVLKSGIFDQKRVEVHVGRVMVEVGCLVRVGSMGCTVTFEMNETSTPEVSVSVVEVNCPVGSMGYKDVSVVVSVRVTDLEDQVGSKDLCQTHWVTFVQISVYRGYRQGSGNPVRLWWSGRPPDG